MKKLIGHIGVDSGQVLICDPCYIDSEWKHEDFNDDRRYKHLNGKVYKYGVNFPNYGVVIPELGKCMNDLIAAKEVTELEPEPAEHNFSYNACCRKSLGDGNGQLNYEMGHAGVGVVNGGFGGDGMYPVYAEYDKDGLVKKITIEFQ